LIKVAKARQSQAAGSNASIMTDYRKAHGLPQRYFLSLGRMVEKKILATLVAAYARYAEGVAVAGER
jgi:hypothetical protein